MFTVALIGPDGVGKTTISRQLEETMAMPTKCVYMGVNVEASNVALPTSRGISLLRRWLGRPTNKGGPLDHANANVTPPGWGRRVLTTSKRTLLLANQLADEWYRQAVVSWYLMRGNLVILDRDFFADYYAYDVADTGNRNSTLRIHGFL